MPIPAAAAIGGAAARSLASRFLLPALRWMGRWVAIPFLGFAVPFFFKVGIFFAVVGFALKISGNLINLGIQYQTTLLNPDNIPVIQTIWTVLRDFVNIFFILILLVIAFATIFNIKNYKASDLLPNLIIAALLINFSLVITSWVIDLLWVPAAVFLKPLGPQISEQIANALSLNKLFSAENIEALTGTEIGFLGTGLTQVFRAALLVVNAFITVWIAFIIWARIPILIGLMIVSPAVWLGYALPLIRKNTWDAWWGTLLNWGVIPIPLFGLIYFIVLFSQRLSAEIRVIPADVLSANISPLGLPLGVVIPWLITVGLLLGGLSFIKGLSGSTYDWTKFGLKKAWGWAGKGAATAYRATGLAGGIEPVKKGLEREGLLGTRAREAREAAIARGLGRAFGLPRYAIERSILDQEEKVRKDIESRLQAARTPQEEKQIIEEAFKKGLSSPEGLAGFMLLAKRGDITVEQIRSATGQLKDMPLVLSRVFSEWKEGKFGGITIDDYLEIMRDEKNVLPLDARRMMYSFAASEDGKKTAEKFEYKDFDTGEQVLGRNTRAGRDYFKFWGDSDPLYVAKYRFDNRTDRVKSGYDEKDLERIRSLQDAIIEQMKRASVKNVADYFYNTWAGDEQIDGVKMGERFEGTLAAIIRAKDEKAAEQFVNELRRRLRREGKDKQLEILNGVIKDIGKEYPEKIYAAEPVPE